MSNVVASEGIPSGRYAIQETRTRPRLSLLHRRLKRLARADVTAPAGIRPTQTSQPLPTRLHELHLLSDQAAHQQPKPGHRRQLDSPNHAIVRHVVLLTTSYRTLTSFFCYKKLTKGVQCPTLSNRLRIECLPSLDMSSFSFFPK